MSKAKEDIKLPEPQTTGKVSLEEAILKRRSRRDFKEKSLDVKQLSQLLWAAQGITQKIGDSGFRAAPSAGALYPIEIYLLNKDGLYHYIPAEHKLDLLSEDDVRQNLMMAAWGQNAILNAPVDIVICAVFARLTGKYGQRGIRYAYIEAGHIAQNIQLEAVSLGLGSVPIGAFGDAEVKEALFLPKDCEPLYIIPVGYPE